MKRLTSIQHKLHLDCVGWRSDEAKWFKPTGKVRFDGELSSFRHTVGISTDKAKLKGRKTKQGTHCMTVHSGGYL